MSSTPTNVIKCKPASELYTDRVEVSGRVFELCHISWIWGVFFTPFSFFDRYNECFAVILKNEFLNHRSVVVVDMHFSEVGFHHYCDSCRFISVGSYRIAVNTAQRQITINICNVSALCL